MRAAALTDQEKKIKRARAEEENVQARRRAMGNMTFVGFLYRAALVTEKIVHVCIQDLLGDPSPEEIECASKLISTAGPALAVRPPPSYSTPWPGWVATAAAAGVSQHGTCSWLDRRGRRRRTHGCMAACFSRGPALLLQR